MQIGPDEPHQHSICYPNEGQSFHLFNMVIRMKTATNKEEGLFSVYEAQIPPYFSELPVHLHRATTEWFYVLSGTLAFTLGEETLVVQQGAYIYVKPNVIHNFWNPSASAVTLLGYRSQPDFAEYLSKLSELIQGELKWPLTENEPLLTLAAQYDQFPS